MLPCRKQYAQPSSSCPRCVGILWTQVGKRRIEQEAFAPQRVEEPFRRRLPILGPPVTPDDKKRTFGRQAGTTLSKPDRPRRRRSREVRSMIRYRFEAAGLILVRDFDLAARSHDGLIDGKPDHRLGAGRLLTTAKLARRSRQR